MNWTDEPEPRLGAYRTVSRFLWWPLGINYETRWLERATWVEEYWWADGGPRWAPLRWALLSSSTDSGKGDGE